ncbi:MAG TPA: beta-ketoacyl-[acyl-carrier-protein] synthase family protein [Candidatus Binatia bacterium]|jgi:3-oxoacyl-[acyl-carrier-protein] synthase II
MLAQDAMQEERCNKVNRRVVVTGLGVISAIGTGKDSFWESLKGGRSGIRKISSFDCSSYKCQIAGEITDFDPCDFMPAQTARRIDRFAQLAVTAARLAVIDAGLDIAREKPGAIGIILGTSVGTLCYAEQQIALFYEKGVKRINPFFATSVIPSSAVTQIMLELGIHGPAWTLTTACASGTGSIGDGFHRVKHGELDIVMAGGAEAPITPLVLSTLSTIEMLSVENDAPQHSYRAFSKDAAGFVLGEGSGILILEELEHALGRGAKIYGEIVGYGASSDGYHVMLFEPSLEQPVAAIRMSLEEAHITPADLGYVNPHGIAIPANDRCEADIFRLALGEAMSKISISATKPLTGHVLGAGGALELVGCCLMLEHQFLHPMINISESDLSYGLDFVPATGRHKAVDAMLSVSFGFGGYNAACVIRRYEN